jgi:perosamine synthetase
VIQVETKNGWLERTVQAVRSVTGPGNISLHQPEFCGNEWAYVKECLDSTFVSSVGAFVDRFERELAAYTRAKHAVAVVNGTAALQVALLLAGVEPGDEVLVPALTFVATANAVHHCHATPHFVDSSAQTLGLDPDALRAWLESTIEMIHGKARNRQTGRRIQAVVPMHTFGHPCDMDGILQVAKEYNLSVVEDAAESLGSLYKGQHMGTFGQLGTLSFNGNKTITTGGGGAILTNDLDLAKKAKHLTTTAKLAHRWEFVHDEAGFNYRMPNLNAALGCAQLERLPRYVSNKRQLADKYKNALVGIDQLELVWEPSECQSNYWLQTIRLKGDGLGHRDSLLSALNDAGLMARPVWRLMHRLEPYRQCPRAPLPAAEHLEETLVNIPSSPSLVASA